MQKSAVVVAMAAVAVLVAAGCTEQSSETSGDHHGQTSQSPSAHEHPSSATGTPGAEAPAAAAHNEADVTFAQHMIPHHSQAVEMTDILLAKSDVDARVVELAKQIKGAQGPEIEQMQGWLDSWGNPPMPAMDHGSMAGMVAPEDIEKLRAAPGPEATKLYLTQMIAHHEGAVAMARDEIENGKYGPAIELSRAIITSQQHEIDTMRAILESL